MKIRARRYVLGLAGACAGVALTALSAVAAADKLPPCEPDKPIPKGGCMAPKDPVTPLDQLRPAPPLTVPPGTVPPGATAPPASAPPAQPGVTVPLPLPPTADAPVIKPPPTGDGEIVKPPPQTDSKMPVLKPATPAPKT